MKSNILCKIINYTIKYSLVSRKGNPLEMDEDSFLVSSCLFHNVTVMNYASESWAWNRPSIAAANKSNRFSFPRTLLLCCSAEPSSEIPKQHTTPRSCELFHEVTRIRVVFFVVVVSFFLRHPQSRNFRLQGDQQN